VIVAHVLGLPVEESVVQLAPAGAAIVTAATIAARTTLHRLRPNGRPRRHGERASVPADDDPPGVVGQR
jgi:hypothetical protein